MMKSEVCSRNVCIKTEATGKSEAPMRVVISFLMFLLVGFVIWSGISITEGVVKRLS